MRESATASEPSSSGASGAYAVIGDDAVLRSPRRYRAGETSVLSSETRTTTSETSGTTRQQQPVVLQAELAQPNEDTQARRQAQFLQEQIDALQARMEEIQPTAQTTPVNTDQGSDCNQQEPTLAHAQPMEDIEAQIQTLQDELEQLRRQNHHNSSSQQDEHMMNHDKDDDVEPPFAHIPLGSESVGDTDESVGKATSMNKKRVYLFGVAVVLLGIVMGVAVGVPLSNRSQSSDDSGRGDVNSTNRTSTPTAGPTSTATSINTNAPTFSTPDEVSSAPISMTSSPDSSTPARSPTDLPTLPVPTTLPTRNPTLFPTLPPTEFPTVSPVSVPNSSSPLPNGPWQQLGVTLNGTFAEEFGRSISLSKDGKVMAVGAPQLFGQGKVSVFRLDAQTQSWTPMGQDLIGEDFFDEFGTSLSLSSDGAVLAVGGHDNDGGGTRAGHVRVFEYDAAGAIWVQRGSDIDGEQSGNRFGSSVALSDSGNILAVGAIGSDTENGVGTGSVQLFQYNNGARSWSAMGQTLNGRAADDSFGFSVSVSSSGMIVGIGAHRNDAGIQRDAGQVSVYQYISESSLWEPLGAPIDGPLENGLFGNSVSLDDSGLVLAVGAPGVCCSLSGASVTVFDYNDATSAWIRRGSALVSRERGDRFGASVSLSRDGNVVAVGIPGRPFGHVQVFQFNANNDMGWTQVGEDIVGEGGFFAGVLSLSGSGTVVGVGAPKGGDLSNASSGYVKVYTLN